MAIKKMTHANGTASPDPIIVDYTIRDALGNVIDTTYAKASTLGTAAAKDFTTSVTDGSADLITSGAVYTALNALPAPMMFKGSATITKSGNTYTVTVTAPASASDIKEGYTYKITSTPSGDTNFKVGDALIASTNNPGTNPQTNWTLIPSGDDVDDTWRSVRVNGTELLGMGISTGAVNFKNGSNVTITGSGNDITIASSYTNNNQTIKSNGTTFGADDAIDLVPVANDAIAIAAVTTGTGAPKITLSGENRSAVANGTDKSVVTTGEKYTWNNKQDAIVVGSELSSDLVDDTNQSHRFVTAEMYEYLDNLLYTRPAVSTFTLYNGGSAVSTTIEKGTTLTIGQIRHNETNLSHISSLALKTGSTTIQSITPAASATTITLDTALSVSATTTYTLSGVNTRNEAFTKDAKINVYSYAYSKTTTATTAPTSGLTKRSVYTTFQSSGETISYTAGDYLYLYVPAASTATHIETNALGSWGSVPTVDCGTVTITKANNTTESYKCFRTQVTFSGTGSAPYRVC